MDFQSWDNLNRTACYQSTLRFSGIRSLHMFHSDQACEWSDSLGCEDAFRGTACCTAIEQLAALSG